MTLSFIGFRSGNIGSAVLKHVGHQQFVIIGDRIVKNVFILGPVEYLFTDAFT